MDHEKDDSDRLKPCPFCGGLAEMDVVRSEAGDDPNEGGYFVACIACDCRTGLRFACGEDPRPLLVEQWNRRTVHEHGRIVTRDLAVTTWREVCGSDQAMAMLPPTGRMLEEFAAKIAAATHKA